MLDYPFSVINRGDRVTVIVFGYQPNPYQQAQPPLIGRIAKAMELYRFAESKGCQCQWFFTGDELEKSLAAEIIGLLQLLDNEEKPIIQQQMEIASSHDTNDNIDSLDQILLEQLKHENSKIFFVSTAGHNQRAAFWAYLSGKIPEFDPAETPRIFVVDAESDDQYDNFLIKNERVLKKRQSIDCSSLPEKRYYSNDLCFGPYFDVNGGLSVAVKRPFKNNHEIDNFLNMVRNYGVNNLNLECCNLSVKQFQQIVDRIVYFNIKLDRLNLNGNIQLSKQSGEILAKLMTEKNCPKYIGLANIPFTDEQLKQWSEELEIYFRAGKVSFLQALVLVNAFNAVVDKSIVEKFLRIVAEVYLEALNLRGNGSLSAVAQKIITMQILPNLKEINISDCRYIFDDALIEGINSNANLKKFIAYGNCPTTDQVNRVAEVLKKKKIWKDSYIFGGVSHLKHCSHQEYQQFNHVLMSDTDMPLQSYRTECDDQVCWLTGNNTTVFICSILGCTSVGFVIGRRSNPYPWDKEKSKNCQQKKSTSSFSSRYFNLSPLRIKSLSKSYSKSVEHKMSDALKFLMKR